MSSKEKLARLKEAEDDAKRFLARAKALREFRTWLDESPEGTITFLASTEAQAREDAAWLFECDPAEVRILAVPAPSF